MRENFVENTELLGVWLEMIIWPCLFSLPPFTYIVASIPGEIIRQLASLFSTSLVTFGLSM